MDFGLLTSRTGGEYICSVVSSCVDRNLLQWQWEVNTADGCLWVKVRPSLSLSTVSVKWDDNGLWSPGSEGERS